MGEDLFDEPGAEALKIILWSAVWELFFPLPIFFTASIQSDLPYIRRLSIIGE
ncbi:MAG: hypothetical protein AAB486_03540 [Patescibacteria group bacterium]